MDHSRPGPQRPLEPALLRDNEARRLDALPSLGIMDIGSQQELDEIRRLACAICQTPMALIALTDEGRQWITSKAGVPTLPEQTFCDLAIVGPDVLVIPDVQADPRFAGHPAALGEPQIRFYAGAPLVTPDGLALGVLCVVDRRTRQLTTNQIDALRTLSRTVMTLGAKRDLERRLAEVEATVPARGIAHDLNNALAPILSVLEFLAPRQKDTQSQELIAVALASAERMAQMIRRIRVLARGVEETAGRSPTSRSPSASRPR